MLTPQEIQEKTFEKAVFGGYDMQAVDEFVEPLTRDYVELYNENAVLKSKLRVLVAKLTELRDEKLAAERQPAAAPAPAAEPAPESPLTAAEAQEQARLQCARELAQNYIDVLEESIRKHLVMLDSLRTRALTEEAEAILAAQEPAPSQEDHTREIAAEISGNLNKMGITEAEDVPLAEEPAEDSPTHKSPTIKVDDLKFGPNYDPNK